jgi:hypothetical protein
MWIKSHCRDVADIRFSRLARRLGIEIPQAYGHIIFLRQWCVEHCGGPQLDGLDADEVETAAQWKGEPGKFTLAALDSDLLIVTESVTPALYDSLRNNHGAVALNGVALADWDEILGSVRNSLKQKRWRDKNKMAQIGDLKQSNKKEPLRNGDVTVDPQIRLDKIRLEEDMSSSTYEPDAAQVKIQQVVEYYRKHHPRARPGAKEKKAIKARLADGYDVSELCQAIDGCHITPYNLGHNEQGAKYLQLELIMRSSSHVQRFAETWASTEPSHGNHESTDWQRLAASNGVVLDAINAARVAQALSENKDHFEKAVRKYSGTSLPQGDLVGRILADVA